MDGKQRADDVVRFFERRLKHVKGKFARQPFILAPWQERIVRDIFGTIKQNGYRRYETAYVEVPKKNGKSELAAGIALNALLMDDEPGAEVYSAAATRDQAGIVFRIAAQMVRNDATLSSMCRIIDSTKTIILRDEPNSFYKAISADADIQDGVEPHCVVFDELHRQRHRDLWDVLKYGMATRRQPLMFAITTAGISGQSPICEELHDYASRIIRGIWQDPSFYPVIFGLDEGDDWTQEGQPARGKQPPTGWYKANPALGDFLPVDRIREEARKAMELPAEQNSFRRLRLNQWVGQETRFIPMDLWQKCGEPIDLASLAGKTCYGGLDLSTTRDLSAFVLVFPIDDKFIWVPFLFLPEDGLYERSRKDNVPYDIWAKQGFVHLTPGNQVDYAFIRKTINDCAEIYDLREVGFDRWNATQIVQQLTDDGRLMVPIGQGFASMSAPTAEMLSQIKTGKLRHGNNPALNWMADCMSVKQDPAGNVKPSKPDRNKSTKRIDGIVAGINASARLIVSPEHQGSVYDGNEPVWLEGA